MRSLSKSTLAVAREALAAAQAALPEYSHKFSRRDFKQQQHFAMLALRKFLKLDYRGMVELLKEWSDLRDTLGLKKVPHHTTLWHAEERLLKKKSFLLCWRR